MFGNGWRNDDVCIDSVSIWRFNISELIPMAIQYSGKVRSSLSFFLGMFLCFGALETVEEWLSEHSH